MYTVETLDLTKYYARGKVKALQDVSLQVEKGQIFSLLGPNGAGKTTLIKILAGLLYPTRGDAKILAQPVSDYKVHARIGYLAENHRFPEFLTAGQMLFYFGKMSGISKHELRRKIPASLRMVKLQDWANVKIKKFSKGMMQRLGLAHALINDPELIFLDEPTDGIDPVGRREVRDILKSLRDQGKTIFLNSHLLSEVERVSDQVAILKNGRLLQKGSVQDFIAVKRQFQLKIHHGEEELENTCGILEIPLTQQNDEFTVAVKDDAHLNLLIDRLRERGILIQAIVPKKITLEDFFIEIIQDK